VSQNGAEILLVEDDPNDVELTLEALRKHGLESKVEVARDGAEALQLVFAEGPYAERRAADRPKVIVLDLKLPKVGGLEVLRRIRTDERSKHIPVVVLTSSEQRRDIAQAYELGANSYAVKPLEFESFAGMISQMALYWLSVNRTPP